MEWIVQTLYVWWPLAILLAVLVLMVVLFERKLKGRGRLSPWSEDFLNSPGQNLLAELNGVRWRFMVLLLGLIGASLLMTGMARWPELDARIVYGMFGAVILVLLILIWRTMQKMPRLRLGLEGECYTGQELSLLMRDGAYVFHDLFMDRRRGNIDHIVIGSGGVFAVETKTRSKSAADGSERARVLFDGQALIYPGGAREAKPIAQAEAQARWLAKFLAGATGEKVPVTPVIALPGRFVETRGEHRVRVINPRRGNALRAWVTQQKLDSKQVERIAWAIEQRCRQVKPWSRQFDPDASSEDQP